MRKVTLNDLAKELNLSPASVGCALSSRAGNTRISEETRRRVREAAKRMKYQSHTGARAMRTSRFNNVGYFTARKARFDYAYTEIVMDGLSERAVNYKQNIVLVQIPCEGERMREIPLALRDRCLDVLIIYDASSFLPGFQEAVEASEIPVVYMNEKRPTNAVYIDDVQTGRLMTAHLIEQGFRKISMLAPQTARDHYSTYDRIAGYQQVMLEAGLTSDVKRFNSKTHKQETELWLTQAERPEAIFCSCDMVALELQQVLYRLSLRVPDDIAISGCDGQEHATRSIVPLTTMTIPFYGMATAAFEMAMQRVEDPAPLPSVVLQPMLVRAESTRRTIITQPTVSS